MCSRFRSIATYRNRCGSPPVRRCSRASVVGNNMRPRFLPAIIGVSAAILVVIAAAVRAQVVVGQDGKDVVYLPTPPERVSKMLDMAGVTPQDYVIDLGSGDGRIVIAAAKRGARALGIEYDGPLVDLSKRLADSEHVGDKARFVQ